MHLLEILSTVSNSSILEFPNISERVIYSAEYARLTLLQYCEFHKDV